MTTNEKTICLARLIGLEHKTVDARVVATRAVAWTDGSVEWRWYPWRPYECEADLEPIRRWLTNQHSYWLHGWDMAASVDGCQQTPAMLCDAVLAAFDPTPEPTERTEHNDAMPPDLPELSEKERRAMESVDMTPILGTPAERLRLAVDTAIRFMRERDVAQTSARMAWGEHNSVVDENERLREQLADITNATTAALDERCDADERHCACVPLLRQEVKRLAAELADSKRDEEWLLARVTADRDACVAFIVNEMAWCEFRGEMLCDSVSVQNANKLAAFLDRHNAANAAERGE